MPKQINKRQKPVWKLVRKPIAPSTKVHQPKKTQPWQKDWQKDLEEEREKL